MAEKAPVVPRVMMAPELPKEVPSINDVKNERDEVLTNYNDSIDAMRALPATATTAEKDKALDAISEARNYRDAFEAMWTEYGGEDIDTAQAAVNTASKSPRSTEHTRALAQLQAAEDAFYGRMKTERDATLDEAYDDNDDFDAKRAKLVTDPIKAEKKAYKEEKRRNKAAANLVHDIDDAHDQALEENANLTRTHDVNTAYDEAREENADLTRIKDIDLAEDMAHLAHDIRLTATRTLDVNTAYDEAREENANLTRVHDIDAAETEAHLEHDAFLDRTRILDADEAHREALADETRVHDIEEAHERANRMNRRGIRGWMSRLREKYGRHGNERDKRRRNVVLVIGAAAVVATAVATWNWDTITDALSSKPRPEAVPNLDELNTDGGSQPAGLPDHLPPTPTEGWPWNWAEQAFGDNATPKLHELADKAAASGDHVVEWFTNPNGTESLKVDGHTDTQYVVDTLRQYR